MARAASGAWRQQNRARQAFLRPQQAALDAVVQHGVEIRSKPRVSTVAQEGVVFPITISNNLAAGSGPPGQRGQAAPGLHLRQPRPADHQADRRADRCRRQDSFTANAEVTARANGIVPVTAQLETESGRKVGQPFVIEVQVTQNGTTGWLIALGAGLVLFGTTALRIRTVAREKAQRSRAGIAEATGTC